MSAVKTLATKIQSEAFLDIIGSCKQYFVDMTNSNREELVQEIIPVIKEIPEFELNAVSPATEISSKINELFGRMAKDAYFKMLCSTRGKEILAKANKYNIPYDTTKTKIDWLLLIDQVNEYDSMLAEAKEYGMYWDISEYDPAGLKSELEEYIRLESTNRSHQYWDYFVRT